MSMRSLVSSWLFLIATGWFIYKQERARSDQSKTEQPTSISGGVTSGFGLAIYRPPTKTFGVRVTHVVIQRALAKCGSADRHVNFTAVNVRRAVDTAQRVSNRYTEEKMIAAAPIYIPHAYHSVQLAELI